MPGLPTFDFVNHIPFSKIRNMAQDHTTAVIEWQNWLILSEHGKGELFLPSCESIDVADEAAWIREVLERENCEFQENLVAEVSHLYLTFFNYIPRFIGINVYLYFRHFP